MRAWPFLEAAPMTERTANRICTWLELLTIAGAIVGGLVWLLT